MAELALDFIKEGDACITYGCKIHELTSMDNLEALVRVLDDIASGTVPAIPGVPLCLSWDHTRLCVELTREASTEGWTWRYN